MSHKQLSNMLEQLIEDAGYVKNEAMICPMIKILQMREQGLSKIDAYMIAKQVIEN